jgi:predicted metalloprotease with PDZ domain
VMRELYNSAYKNDRGFTAAEWWSAVSRAANGKSFADFNTRYIDGREAYPWDAVLPLAGMRLARDTVNEPRVGIGTVQDSAGVHVTEVVAGSAAEAAGVQVGDILVAVGGLSAADPAWSPTFRLKYARSPEGTSLPILVRRNGREQTLQARLRFVARVESRLVEDPSASAKARRIREGILRGITSTR